MKSKNDVEMSLSENAPQISPKRALFFVSAWR